MKTKNKIQTWLNYEFNPKVHCERVYGRSLTVPDHSQNIKTIIEKCYAGVPVPINRNMKFGGDDVVVGNTIDPIETLNALTNYQDSLRQRKLNADLEYKKKVEEEKEAEKARIIAEYEASKTP